MILFRYPPLIWLRFVPPGPVGVVGLMLFLIGALPPGRVTTLYAAAGAGVLGVAWLAVLPSRALQRLHNRVYWPLGVSGALALAFILPAWPQLMYVGGAIGLVAALAGLARRVRERYLALPELFAEVVGDSDGIDYAALFDLDSDGRPVKVLSATDPRLPWHLQRFALAPAADDKAAALQVAAWDAVAVRMHEILQGLDTALASTGQGANARAVFDIDMGGLFFTRIHPTRFLFAATLDQAVMNDDSCDRDVRTLVRAIATRTSAYGAFAAEE